MPWSPRLLARLAARSAEWLLALLLAGGLAATAPGATSLLPGAASAPVAGLCTATSLTYAPDVNGYATMGNVSSGSPFAANTAFNSVSIVHFWHTTVSTPWRSFTSSGSTTNCNNYYKYESWRGTAASSAGNTIVAKWGLMANIRYANTAGAGIQPLASSYAWHSTTLNVVPTAYSTKWGHTLVEGVYAAAGQSVLWAPCTSVYASASALSNADTGAAPGANCEAVASDTTLAGAATFTYDATIPSLAATVPASSATSPIVFTLTDGNYNGVAPLNAGTVTASDFTISNGTFSSASCTGGACSVSVTPAGQGAVTFAPSGTMSISDLATNAQTSAWTAASTVYDTVAPSVTSFTARTPGPTSQASLTFDLAFSESVTGLTAGDLTVTGTATGWTIQNVSGSGAAYTVKVNGSGGSDGTVSLTLAAGSVADAAGNTGPAASVTSGTSIIHTGAPAVLSFTTAVTSPTNSTSIDYALVFDEPVTGLAPADFTNTGTATGCAFAVAGSNTSYTLTVTGCGTSGTLAPRLAANAVTDLAANTGPGTAVTGPTLTLDRIAPTATAFTTAVVSPTTTTTQAYSVTFSESVTGLAAGDFSNAGTATGCSFAVSGSGTSYTLTVTTCGTSGTLVPRLAGAGAVDTAGNTGPASATDGPPLTLDRVAPVVSSFTSAVSSPTNSTSIAYTLALSESVTGIIAADFANAGTATGCSFTPGAASGSSVTVTVTGCSTTGTLQPRLLAGTIADAAGNAGPAANSDATTTLVLDRVAPAVSSFTSAVSSPTNSTSIAYTLVFSESVTGLAAGDFTNAGTATGCTFTPSGSSASYTLTATGCGTTGTLAPRLLAAGVTDTAGTTGPAANSDATTTLTLDRIAPVVSSFTTAAGSPTNSASIDYSLVFSESVTGLAAGDVSNAGTATACAFTVGGSGASYTLTVTGCSTSGTLVPRLAADGVADAAGNTGPASAPDGPSLTLDRVAPSVASFTTAASSPTTATSIVYTLVLDENVAGLAPGDVSNAGTATGCAFAVAGSGASYTVTVTGCSLEATLTPQLAAGSVVDSAGNAGPAGASSGSTLYLGTGSPTGFTITAGDFDFGSAGPGGGLSASTGLTVLGSNPTGYEVTLVLSDLVTASPRVTADRINASGVALASCPTVLAAGAATAICPAGGLHVARMIVHATSATLLAGDRFTIALAVVVPWVADGAYSGTATFEVTAL